MVLLVSALAVHFALNDRRNSGSLWVFCAVRLCPRSREKRADQVDRNTRGPEMRITRILWDDGLPFSLSSIGLFAPRRTTVPVKESSRESVNCGSKLSGEK